VHIVHQNDNTVEVTRTCPFCNKEHTMRFNTEAFNAWMGGEHVQNAFPQSSAAHREFLLSGAHDECFNEAFSEEDE
jgi:hypothetical protein